MNSACTVSTVLNPVCGLIWFLQLKQKIRDSSSTGSSEADDGCVLRTVPRLQKYADSWDNVQLLEKISSPFTFAASPPYVAASTNTS